MIISTQEVLFNKLMEHVMQEMNKKFKQYGLLTSCVACNPKTLKFAIQWHPYEKMDAKMKDLIDLIYNKSMEIFRQEIKMNGLESYVMKLEGVNNENKSE